MIDGELESEEEFDDLMRRAGHDTPTAVQQALGRYRDRFPTFVKRGQREFLNRVAEDLQELISGGRASEEQAGRELGAAE